MNAVNESNCLAKFRSSFEEIAPGGGQCAKHAQGGKVRAQALRSALNTN